MEVNREVKRLLGAKIIIKRGPGRARITWDKVAAKAI